MRRATEIECKQYKLDDKFFAKIKDLYNAGNKLTVLSDIEDCIVKLDLMYVDNGEVYATYMITIANAEHQILYLQVLCIESHEIILHCVQDNNALNVEKCTGKISDAIELARQLRALYNIENIEHSGREVIV